MISIINLLKKIPRLKASVALLTCLLFLLFPSCQKEELDPLSLQNMDIVVSSASSQSSSVIYYYGPLRFYGSAKDITIDDVTFVNFADAFVLNVTTSMNSKKGKLPINVYINEVMVIEPSDFIGKTTVSKKLKSFTNPASLVVEMVPSNPGVDYLELWIEASLKPTPVKSGMIRDAEGNNYNTIEIGEQVWMAENLKTTRYNDGTLIFLPPSPAPSEPMPIVDPMYGPNYYWYADNPTENRADYGALYNWYAVNTGKLCPSGWHVPSTEEWHNLVLYLDNKATSNVYPEFESITAGNMLKETGTLHWQDNVDATNESGFTALPGGLKDFISTSILGYEGLTKGGWWWSSTAGKTVDDAWCRNLSLNNGNVAMDCYKQYYALSVRCLKNY